VASKRDVSEEELELAPYRIACPQHSQADEACSGSIKLGGGGWVGRSGGNGGMEEDVRSTGSEKSELR
jgi:hypothetical protein